MPTTVSQDPMTEEEAVANIVKRLTGPAPRPNPFINSYGHLPYIPAMTNDLIIGKLEGFGRNSNPTTYAHEPNLNTNQLYIAEWSLCRRGILYPTPAPLGNQLHTAHVPGCGFGLTDYGKKWLANQNTYDVSPIDHGKFLEVLANHRARFWIGYQARSQEALACYQAQIFLSCCAMCGAAAESILLALCSAKTGNPVRVLKEEEEELRGRYSLMGLLLSKRRY